MQAKSLSSPLKPQWVYVPLRGAYLAGVVLLSVVGLIKRWDEPTALLRRLAFSSIWEKGSICGELARLL